MERSKIKTFVIAALLAVNVFFLALVISKEMDSAAIREQMKADAVQIMSQNGITINPDIIPGNINLYSYIVARDIDSEKTLAQTILGNCSPEDQGGNIYYYSGSGGHARFRGGGEFEIFPVEGAYTSSNNVESAYSLSKVMGIGVDKGSAVISADEDGQTVSFVCTWTGFGVFNCRISFLFENGNLTQIYGRRLMGSPQASGDDELITAEAALIDFLNIIKQQGYICNEILSISEGYILSLSVSGEGNLIPIWRISTDTGECYINAVTGLSETVMD